MKKTKASKDSSKGTITKVKKENCLGCGKPKK